VNKWLNGETSEKTSTIAPDATKTLKKASREQTQIGWVIG
jgi:hypothetical protein